MMKTNKSEFLDSLSSAAEVRRVFTRLMDRYDAGTQLFIESCYDNQEIRSVYTALRVAAKLGHEGKGKNHQEVLRFPNQIVYEFLNQVFAPKYGPAWLTDKSILGRVLRDEDLIKPWIVAGL